MRFESNNERALEFRANLDLNHLLGEVNDKLSTADSEYELGVAESFRPLFIVGPPRSGTTLFMQWLAASGLVSYPTNMLSRFYGAPLIGAKIQQLLTDPVYSFRDELTDLSPPRNFSSHNGKTSGALSPNEFWFFWRRFLRFETLDYAPDDELRQNHDLDGLANGIKSLANIFAKPFALKGMILNQSLPILAEKFADPLFIWIKRDPLMTIQSILEARVKQFGDDQHWYSFKIREYPELVSLQPVESVAGQVASLNKSIDRGLGQLPPDQTLIVDYEAFCAQPGSFLTQLAGALGEEVARQARDLPSGFLNRSFPVRKTWSLSSSLRTTERIYRRALENELY
ncbi:sulfotransferase [Pontimonas sp.]|nr:sulfotransferase [Pontimonas sp.]